MAGLITFLIWLMIAGRRLHDFNASALWGLTGSGSAFLLGFANGFLTGAGLEVLSNAGLDTVLGIVTVAIVVAIGILPGTPASNRFGPIVRTPK